MKKILIIALLSFIGFSGYSNQLNDTVLNKITNNVSNIISDTSQITFKEVYSDVKEGLKGLSGALKVGTEHVYEILIKQQRIDAILWIIFDTSFLCFTIITFIFWYKDKHDRDEWWGVPLVMGIITLIVICSTISTIITGFANPEYGAMKEIIYFINK